MHKFILTTIATLCVLGMFAQETSLRGTLKEDGTGLPVAGATIRLANQDITTTTNASGEFSFSNIIAIDEEVLVMAEGFLDQVKLVQIKEGIANEMEAVSLESNLEKDIKDEQTIQVADVDLNDDEGKSQTMAAGYCNSNDVFNSAAAYSLSNGRYTRRGLDGQFSKTYINGINFNGAERGTFSYSSLAGLTEAGRYKDGNNEIEASNFTFGDLGQASNILMNASRYAQGFKLGVAGSNRNYKGRVQFTYASGPLANNWFVMASVGYRYSPYCTQKGIIGEGIAYNSLSYMLSVEKLFGEKNQHSLSFITLGAPTERGQNSANTDEVFSLTGSINYNPYWGYQTVNGQKRMRNSRTVKSFDPIGILSYDWKIDDCQHLRVGAAYHYSFYSNSSLNYYNVPDPRPDYYRNLPSYLKDSHYSLNTETGEATLKEQNINQTAYDELTKLWTSRDDAVTQINWDNLYATNLSNNINNPDGCARYILERRHNNIQEATLSINYSGKLTNHLTLSAGLEGKYSQGIHYKTIEDLLGGRQWIDIDPFSERDVKELAANIGLSATEVDKVKQNDVRKENTIINNTSTRFGYDYDINMLNANAWIQNEWNFQHINFYYALSVTLSEFDRTSRMMNGRAWYLAQSAINSGDNLSAYYYLGYDYKQILAEKNDLSKLSGLYRGFQHTFVDPAFKIGAKFSINARNRIKINALAETKAPTARDSYISARVHDRVVNTIYTHDYATNLLDYYGASEKIIGGDLTYEFNYPVMRGRVTAFYTQFWDGTQLTGYYDDQAQTFVNQAMSGIDKVHRGVEAALSFPLGNMFTLTGIAAIGDYRYTSNALAVSSAENGMALVDDKNTNITELTDSVYLKGLKVAAGPQISAGLKLSFFYNMWFADLTINYYDWNSLNYAASRRSQGLFTGTRADGTKVSGYQVMVTDNATGETRCMEAGEAFGTAGVTVQRDKYGIPVVAPVHQALSEQESLTPSKWYNRFFLNLSVGKLIYLKNKQQLTINASVSNVTNNTHFKTGGYQQSRVPRTTDDDKKISLNGDKFPSKYYYASGVNCYITINYKF